MEGKIIPSIILAAGFIGGVALFGNQVGDGVNALLNKDRIVTVKGLCEKEVKANHVIWPLSFNEMGNDLATVWQIITALTGRRSATSLLKSSRLRRIK